MEKLTQSLNEQDKQMQEQVRRLERVLHTLTQGGLGYVLRTKLKFKFLCLDALEQPFSGANQLPVAIPYDTEVKKSECFSRRNRKQQWPGCLGDVLPLAHVPSNPLVPQPEDNGHSCSRVM